MAESPETTDNLGPSFSLPKLTFAVWVVLGGLLVGQTVVHGVLMLPAVAAAYVVEPSLVAFILFAGIGWILFHAVDTVGLMRDIGTNDLPEIMRELNNTSTLKVISLMAIYINTVIGIGAVLGYIVSLWTGNSLLGVAIALGYANLDLNKARSWYTPGSVILMTVLRMLHIIGIVRDVDTSMIVNSISTGPIPVRDNQSPA